MQEQRSSWAIGWTMFAAFVMIMIGFFQAIEGLAAVIKDEYFVVGPEYLYKVDVTTWGWIHLILGLVIFFAGFGLFTGAVWARTVRCDHGRGERDRELRVAALPARVVRPDHHAEHRRDLGPDGPRTRHRRVIRRARPRG